MAQMMIRCSDAEYEAFKEAAYQARMSLNKWVLGRLSEGGTDVPRERVQAGPRFKAEVAKGSRELTVDRDDEEGFR